MNTTNEKPDIEERYMSACTASNLRVEADRPSAADIIIAAGWSQSRIGGALLRLHTEYDASERLRLATADQFLPEGKTTKEQRGRAAHDAHVFNLHEAGLLLGKLKTLPVVREQITLQMVKWKIAEPQEKGIQVLRWWLAQTCPTCRGTKFQCVPGTDRQSGKACAKCRGTGLREVPCEQEGRKLANFLDQCVARARLEIARRLRPDHA